MFKTKRPNMTHRIVNKTTKRKSHSPSLPTIKLMSAINSLLNIAAFRSRTVDFVACQFGSPVFMIGHKFPLDGIQNDVLRTAPGEANGDDGDDDGALHGCET